MISCGETFYFCTSCKILCGGIRQRKVHDRHSCLTLCQVLTKKKFKREADYLQHFLRAFEKIGARTDQANEILLFPYSQEVCCGLYDSELALQYCRELKSYQKLELKANVVQSKYHSMKDRHFSKMEEWESMLSVIQPVLVGLDRAIIRTMKTGSGKFDPRSITQLLTFWVTKRQEVLPMLEQDPRNNINGRCPFQMYFNEHVLGINPNA
jgi:hypothetical protein